MSSPSLKDEVASLKEVVGKDTSCNSENASNSSASNGEGGGNNSDNSALISLGNTSFGFNFESDGGFKNGNYSSGSNSNENSDEGDSDQGHRNQNRDRKSKAKPKSGGNNSNSPIRDVSSPTRRMSGTGSSSVPEGISTSTANHETNPNEPQSPPRDSISTLTSLSPPSSIHPVNSAPMSAGAAAAKLKSDLLKSPPQGGSGAGSVVDDLKDTTVDVPVDVGVDVDGGAGTHQDAAAMAVANLNQIATDALKETDAENEDGEKRGLKRKSSIGDAGYNSDYFGSEKSETGSKKDPHAHAYADFAASSNSASKQLKTAPGGVGGSKKKLDESKREERNAREKERSFRISKQINELRALLSSGGVIVPKGTKSSVLTEAANYIRMLQQHQYRSEIDRHQLVQQVQRIGGGALGQQAAQAVRHVAAQNGVWSLGSFGGVPPKSAMMYHQPNAAPSAPGVAIAEEAPSSNSGSLSNKIEETDYRHVFNSCTIGMAIASMGGAFIDCNKFFCQISNYTKQEICSLTVFNLTARQDLQSAFDLISQMLSAPLDPTVINTSCVLRGALKHRQDVGLSVKLIKANDGVAKCFCVTLIQNPTSPFDMSRPLPAVAIAGQGPMEAGAKTQVQQAGFDPAPAYTTG